MASLFGPLPTTIRLLDAGAGAGGLTAAFVSRLCEGNENVRSVEAVLYEVDAFTQRPLLDTMQNCQRLCAQAGIQFAFTIHVTDFILEMSVRVGNDLFCEQMPAFDVAIANPPYRKIGIDSAERRNLRRAGIETTNLYTGFIALIHRLLVPGGQLVAITPRSFCNGTYFRDFRGDLLENLEIHRLHVFESRDAAFRKDSVLQENVIFHVVKGRSQPPQITVSSSSGEEGGAIGKSIVPFAEVVRPLDAEKFIHIPSASDHTAARKVIEDLRSNLASLGVSVSTGPVVDFRLKNALRSQPQEGTAPLVYPCHFNGGGVHWPKRQSRKPNAILDNSETRPWLVRSGLYLLTKRFTSKEERRRIVACIFDPQTVSAEWVGFENHLNYFHSNGGGLDRHLAYGLFAFLNSTVVDQYFRRFSGHTQVNATDLRTLSYPDRKTLQAMGRALPKLDVTQAQIDRLVEDFLHAPQ
jgi:adenine-specific DNA-methyltransferase